jgi:hypothetical protein
MGREIREVPLNWNHPKDARGQYVPNHCYVLTAEMRAEYVDDEGNDEWKEEWAESYLAEPWPADAAMGFALYENVSEGTPITPTFATRQDLADYLVANGDFWGNRWSRAAADGITKVGWAPSMMMRGGVMYEPNDAGMYTKDGS